MPLIPHDHPLAVRRDWPDLHSEALVDADAQLPAAKYEPTPAGSKQRPKLIPGSMRILVYGTAKAAAQ